MTHKMTMQEQPQWWVVNLDILNSLRTILLLMVEIVVLVERCLLHKPRSFQLQWHKEQHLLIVLLLLLTVVMLGRRQQGQPLQQAHLQLCRSTTIAWLQQVFISASKQHLQASMCNNNTQEQEGEEEGRPRVGLAL
jgi:hypothetical protein